MLNVVLPGDFRESAVIVASGNPDQLQLVGMGGDYPQRGLTDRAGCA